MRFPGFGKRIFITRRDRSRPVLNDPSNYHNSTLYRPEICLQLLFIF